MKIYEMQVRCSRLIYEHHPAANRSDVKLYIGAIDSSPDPIAAEQAEIQALGL